MHSRSQKTTLHNLIVKIKEMKKKNHTAGLSLLEVGGQKQVTGNDPGMVRGGGRDGLSSINDQLCHLRQDLDSVSPKFPNLTWQ